MESSHTANLNLPDLPAEAGDCHIFPTLTSRSLLSIGQLCDHDCKVTFTKTNFTVNRESKIAPLPEIRGDVSAHGFWTRGMAAMFDIQVMDTECPSQRGSDPGVILKCHEAEKKRKYLAHCECQHKHFTPLVFSVDGMMGMECDAARKKAGITPSSLVEADL
eukprot:scaffold50382_cov35-Attheya_sp.AAC.2